MSGARVPIEKRFWTKVQKAGPLECWLWIAHRDNKGYGRVNVDGRCRLAHRVAWRLTKGRWPNVLMHSCDNPPCVNPEHLSDGTMLENSQDSVRKDRHARGERSGRVKLRDEEVVAIRHLLAGGAQQKEIAAAYGITQGNVSSIALGNSWSHL